MLTIYRCPYCGKEFHCRDLARGHVKSKHREAVHQALSQLSQRKIERLRARNIDPENWAAGWILSMMPSK
jgi:transposase-like protein